MNIARAYGLVLQQARIDAGLTQDETAARSGYSREFISRLENGKKVPTLATVFDLANAVYISPVEIVARVSKKIKT